MFDIGFPELLLAAAIALVVIGPRRLPGAMSTLGKWIGAARRSFIGIRRQIEKERGLEAMQKPQGAENRITRGDLELDVDRMTVRWQDQPVGLTLTEFWMIHALARYPGHVKNRQQLMDAAQAVLDDNTITSHIKRVRRKFVAIDPDFAAIETVYGMGYRWISG